MLTVRIQEKNYSESIMVLKLKDGFTEKLLRKQACTQLFGKYSRMAQLSKNFSKIPLHFSETPGIIPDFQS